MRVAELLSDLTSLRACDPAAALALVSARGAATDDGPRRTAASDARDNDADLQRAKDLVELHHSVKLASENGTLERILREARGVVAELDIGGKKE